MEHEGQFCTWCKLQVAGEPCLAIHQAHHGGAIASKIWQCLLTDGGTVPCYRWCPSKAAMQVHLFDEHRGQRWLPRVDQRAALHRSLQPAQPHERIRFLRRFGGVPAAQLGATAEKVDAEGPLLEEHRRRCLRRRLRRAEERQRSPVARLADGRRAKFTTNIVN